MNDRVFRSLTQEVTKKTLFSSSWVALTKPSRHSRRSGNPGPLLPSNLIGSAGMVQVEPSACPPGAS